MADGTVKIDVTLDDKGAVKGVEQLDKSLGGLESGAQKANVSVGNMLKTLGLAKIAKAGIDMVKQSIDGAISRYDVLNNSEKVFENMGFEAAESSAMMDNLLDSILGLPTPLEAAVQGVQGIAAANGDLDEAQKIYSALNNSILGVGKGGEEVNGAMEMLTRGINSGKIQGQEFNTLMNTMGPNMQAVAREMGYTTGELQKGLSDGSISVEEFTDNLIKMNTEGGGGMASFEQQAQDMTAGIGTAMANARTAVVRSVANIIGAIDDGLTAVDLPTIGQMINNFGDLVSDVFGKIAEAIPPIIEKIVGIYNALEPWLPLIKSVGGAIITMLAIWSGINKVVGTVTKLKGTIETLFGVLTKNPWMLALAAAITVALLIYKHWDEIKEFFSQFWEWLKETGAAVWEPIKAAWASAVEFFSDLWSGIKDYFAEIWEGIKEIALAIWEPIQQIWSEVVNIFKQLWEPVKEFFLEIWEAIKEVALQVWEPIQEAWTAVTEYFREVWSGIKEFFSELWEEIKEVALEVWEPIREIWSEFIEWGTEKWNTLKEFFMELWTAISDFAQTTWGSIRDFLSEIWGGITDSATERFNSIKEFITSIWEGIKNLTNTIWEGIKSFLATIWEGIKTVVSEGINEIKTRITNAWNNIKTLTSTIWEAIKTLIQGTWENIKTVIDTTLNVIKTIITTVWNVIKGIITAVMALIKGDISGAWNAIKGIISSVMNGIKSIISSIWNGIKSIVSNTTNAIRSTISSVFNSLKGIVSGAFNGVKSAIRSGLTAGLNIVTNMGTKFKNAGRKIVTMLADGINGAAKKVTDAASNLMGKVRDFLPFSPAKVGPLTDIDNLDFGGPIEDSIDDAMPKIRGSLNSLLNIPDVTAGNIEVAKEKRRNRNAEGATYHNDNGVTLTIENIENNSDSDIPRILEESAWIIEGKKRGRLDG